MCFLLFACCMWSFVVCNLFVVYVFVVSVCVVRWLLLVCRVLVGCVLLLACWLLCVVSCWLVVVCCKSFVVCHGLSLLVRCLWCSVCGVPCTVR